VATGVTTAAATGVGRAAAASAADGDRDGGGAAPVVAAVTVGGGLAAAARCPSVTPAAVAVEPPAALPAGGAPAEAVTGTAAAPSATAGAATPLAGDVAAFGGTAAALAGATAALAGATAALAGATAALAGAAAALADAAADGGARSRGSRHRVDSSRCSMLCCRNTATVSSAPDRARSGSPAAAATPSAAAIQMLAAVVSPRWGPLPLMQPAPRKPTPDAIWAATRLASPAGKPTREVRVKMADPSDTSISVRKPAVDLAARRSTPMMPPTSIAMRRRVSMWSSASRVMWGAA